MDLNFTKTMKLLNKVSSWKSFVVLLSLYIFFVVFVMSGMMNGGETQHQPLDLLFSYTPQQAYDLITGYGEVRSRYALFSMSADTVYPIIYTSLFMILIMQLCRGVWPHKMSFHRIALFPLFALFFDLCENICIITMIKIFPQQNDALATISSLFTNLKWASVAGIGIIIVVLAIWGLSKKLFTM